MVFGLRCEHDLDAWDVDWCGVLDNIVGKILPEASAQSAPSPHVAMAGVIAVKDDKTVQTARAIV